MDQRITRYAADKVLGARQIVNEAIMKDCELSFTIAPELQAHDPNWVERTVIVGFSHIEDEVKQIILELVNQAYLDGIAAVEGYMERLVSDANFRGDRTSAHTYGKHLEAVRMASGYLK